jgi:hypothetical protein
MDPSWAPILTHPAPHFMCWREQRHDLFERKMVPTYGIGIAAATEPPQPGEPGG